MQALVVLSCAAITVFALTTWGVPGFFTAIGAIAAVGIGLEIKDRIQGRR